jgi:hypothetical protein
MMPRLCLIAAGVLAALVAVSEQAMSDAPRGLPPSWLELKKGTRAYTIFDAVSVCGSAQEWLEHTNNPTIKCAEKSGGVPVTIASDEIAKYDLGEGPFGGNEYGVFVRADDGSWSGWIYSGDLMPRIPAHTKLMIVPYEPFKTALLYADEDGTPLVDPNAPPAQDWEQESDRFTPAQKRALALTQTEELNKGMIVEFISQEPRNFHNLNLQIDRGDRVPNAIRRGWLSSVQAFLPDNQPLTLQPQIGYSFKSLNIGSLGHGTPITKGKLIGSIVTIDTTVPGCNSQEDMDRLQKFAKANDSVGLSAFVTPRLATGECVLLLLGDSVRIDATDNVLDHFCVRPKDQARCFWTLFGAMRNSLERLSRISPAQ